MCPKLLIAAWLLVAVATTTAAATPITTAAATAPATVAATLTATAAKSTTVAIANRRGVRHGDVAGLQALLALFNLVLHFVAFVEVLKTLTCDSREVNEHICSAIILLNEPKTLFTVEPLDFTCRHVAFSYAQCEMPGINI